MCNCMVFYAKQKVPVFICSDIIQKNKKNFLKKSEDDDTCRGLQQVFDTERIRRKQRGIEPAGE